MTNTIGITSEDTSWAEVLLLRLRQEDPIQYTTLVKMHLSFTTDLPTFGDNADSRPNSGVSWRQLAPLIRWLSGGSKRSSSAFQTNETISSELLEQLLLIINYLRTPSNMTTEGLFRKCGSSSRQAELRQLLLQHTCDSSVLHDALASCTPHDAASLLKGLLAELPEPILQDSNFALHCKLAEVDQEKGSTNSCRRLKALQLLLLLLPARSLLLLRSLLHLLHTVSLHEHLNKMSTANLGMVFAPHILCPRKLSGSELQQLSAVAGMAVAYMVERAPELFQIPTELECDVRQYWSNRKQAALQQQHLMLHTNASCCCCTHNACNTSSLAAFQFEATNDLSSYECRQDDSALKSNVEDARMDSTARDEVEGQRLPSSNLSGFGDPMTPCRAHETSVITRNYYHPSSEVTGCFKDSVVVHEQSLISCPERESVKQCLQQQLANLPLSPDHDPTLARTVFSFVDHQQTQAANNRETTAIALAELYAHVNNLPDTDKKKRRLVKQFNAASGRGTPRYLSSGTSGAVASKAAAFASSIKRHLLGSRKDSNGSSSHQKSSKCCDVSSPSTQSSAPRRLLRQVCCNTPDSSSNFRATPYGSHGHSTCVAAPATPPVGAMATPISCVKTPQHGRAKSWDNLASPRHLRRRRCLFPNSGKMSVSSPFFCRRKNLSSTASSASPAPNRPLSCGLSLGSPGVAHSLNFETEIDFKKNLPSCENSTRTAVEISCSLEKTCHASGKSLDSELKKQLQSKGPLGLITVNSSSVQNSHELERKNPASSVATTSTIKTISEENADCQSKLLMIEDLQMEHKAVEAQSSYSRELSLGTICRRADELIDLSRNRRKLLAANIALFSTLSHSPAIDAQVAIEPQSPNKDKSVDGEEETNATLLSSQERKSSLGANVSLSQTNGSCVHITGIEQADSSSERVDVGDFVSNPCTSHPNHHLDIGLSPASPLTSAMLQDPVSQAAILTPRSRQPLVAAAPVRPPHYERLKPTARLQLRELQRQRVGTAAEACAGNKGQKNIRSNAEKKTEGTDETVSVNAIQSSSSVSSLSHAMRRNLSKRLNKSRRLFGSYIEDADSDGADNWPDFDCEITTVSVASEENFGFGDPNSNCTESSLNPERQVTNTQNKHFSMNEKTKSTRNIATLSSNQACLSSLLNNDQRNRSSDQNIQPLSPFSRSPEGTTAFRSAGAFNTEHQFTSSTSEALGSFFRHLSTSSLSEIAKRLKIYNDATLSHSLHRRRSCVNSFTKHALSPIVAESAAGSEEDTNSSLNESLSLVFREYLEGRTIASITPTIVVAAATEDAHKCPSRSPSLSSCDTNDNCSDVSRSNPLLQVLSQQSSAGHTICARSVSCGAIDAISTVRETIYCSFELSDDEATSECRLVDELYACDDGADALRKIDDSSLLEATSESFHSAREKLSESLLRCLDGENLLSMSYDSGFPVASVESDAVLTFTNQTFDSSAGTSIISTCSAVNTESLVPLSSDLATINVNTTAKKFADYELSTIKLVPDALIKRAENKENVPPPNNETLVFYTDIVPFHSNLKDSIQIATKASVPAQRDQSTPPIKAKALHHDCCLNILGCKHGTPKRKAGNSTQDEDNSVRVNKVHFETCL